MISHDITKWIVTVYTDTQQIKNVMHLMQYEPNGRHREYHIGMLM